MRHLLMDPAFPDIVGEWAADPGETGGSEASASANDNGEDSPDDFSDPLLAALGKLEIAATRLW
jgi:hypothetical protein